MAVHPCVRTSKRLLDGKGLTLVEVLIAMVILLFVSLALMQTALLSIDSNMKNILRDEAVSIADQKMDEARNEPFSSLATISNVPVTRDIRKIQNFSYSVRRSVTNVNTDNKQVDITVGWTWKGQPYSHTISTIVRNESG
jgi:prepilin-type N-terminal cleavage/methylation domain-containing protein